MRSRNLAAVIGISLVSACGGSGYGDYGDDDQDNQTDKVEARDAGAWDARAKDDAGKTSWADGGGSGGGSSSGGSGDADDDDDAPADAGVGADAGKDAGGGGGGGGATDCATLTYQSFGRQFMSNYCVSCHGGAAPAGQVNLTSLANVVRNKSDVKDEVSSGGMPLGGKQPSDDERAKLSAWIDCGPK